MEKALVTVELGENNYSAHINIGDGIAVATGETLDELKKEMESAVEFHIDGMREDGDEIPAPFDGAYQLAYKFDAEALLTHYKDIIPFASLERITGIDQRQLYRYASGRSRPRAEQSQKIVAALHGLGRELLGVEL